jgi:hypothetical protein
LFDVPGGKVGTPVTYVLGSDDHKRTVSAKVKILLP